MAKLDLDTAAVVDLYGLPDDLSWPDIVFEHYEIDEITPIPLTGEWQMNIMRKDVIVYTLDESEGITVSDNVLTIAKPPGLQLEAKAYQYNILNKVDADTYLIYKGVLIIQNTEPWQ